jgi:cobalamin biosynthesis protein CobT
MLKDSLDAKSEFDKHEFNTESYMESQFEKAIAKEPKVQNLQGKYYGRKAEINPKHVSVPFTREYDKVTDYSGKGDRDQYAERKRMVMKHVNPIKQHMERVLLVKENKKMIPERERGMLNNRTLANLCIDKNYRTPFRQFTKIDTKNVAVQLVIDCSGSMGGNKIEVARQTALALAESLKSLGIMCEIVGFNTNDHINMASRARGLSSADIARFNRFGTGLNHMIFKSFDSNDLSGICMARSGGCNADGESITWAAKRLAERREKRKFMIVLSDGQPSYGGANDEVLMGDLKRVINMLPKAGIEPIGIGICTRDPELFYNDYVIVTDVKELSKTVIVKLAKLLEEGYKR